MGAVLLLLVAGVGATSASGAIARSRPVAARGRPAGAGLARCAQAIFGVGLPVASARPVAGSASPTVTSSFAVFRRPRTAADRPPVAGLGQVLGPAGAQTYDPSASVRLLRLGAHSALYAVPATVAVPGLPAVCAGRAGARAYVGLRADLTGNGPGVCLLDTQLAPPAPGLLPGRRRPRRQLAVAEVKCASEAVLSGYVGALGQVNIGTARDHALIPDGISSITYTLPDGRVVTAPVAGNLFTPPPALSDRRPPRHPSAGELARLVAAHLPTTVTETGPGGQAVATLTRPASLIADTVGAYFFARRLFTVSGTSGTSTSGTSTSGTSTSGAGASCSARTHRCVAVTVTTTCRRERCHTYRTIHRYRYRTARPPAGTTGPDHQPTGPIVARVNRLVSHPTKLALVLSGAPHRRVAVLLSVSCFARHSGAGIAGPPLMVRVPSRTPIALPGRARSFRACDVGALVVSRRHGPVHATIARR